MSILLRRQLTEPEKKEYLNAILCLTKKEAKSSFTGLVHRYDDHVAIHNSQTPAIS
jgi:tyrosinase